MANTINLDLSTWIAESYPELSDPGHEPAIWTAAPSGHSVFQSTNGQPTLLYSDLNLFDGPIEVDIRVTGSDDDFVGFALGFQAGDTSNPNANYWLVDWKGANQFLDFGSPSCTPGSAALAGLSLSRVFGIPTADEFWGHTNFDEPNCSGLGSGIEEIARATNLGSTGWARSTAYKLTFELDGDNLRVFVNDVIEIDAVVDGSDGGFAFYNFTQPGVVYGPAMMVQDFEPLLGDLNCDEERNIVDAVLLLQAIVGLIELTDCRSDTPLKQGAGI